MIRFTLIFCLLIISLGPPLRGQSIRPDTVLSDHLTGKEPIYEFCDSKALFIDKSSKGGSILPKSADLKLRGFVSRKFEMPKYVEGASCCYTLYFSYVVDTIGRVRKVSVPMVYIAHLQDPIDEATLTIVHKLYEALTAVFDPEVIYFQPAIQNGEAVFSRQISSIKIKW